MSATHLNASASKHPSYTESTDFLNLEEPPAAKESPSGSQFCLADFNDANKDSCAGHGSYTHSYQQGLRQARLVNSQDRASRPPVGAPVRRRSTNYIDALQDKANGQAANSSPEPQDQTPVFKPSYTAGGQEKGFDETEELVRPQPEERKSSFAYEDFKKDAYDRLNMFEKE